MIFEDCIKNKKVTIILVNYKNYTDTIKCLKTLEKVDYQNLSVIVVDNDSKDESVEILKKYIDDRKCIDDRVEIVESRYNGGFAYGNNFGIKMALERGSDYILLLNNDTIVDKDFLTPLLQAADGDEKVGIVSPRIMFYPDVDKVWFAGGEVDWSNLRAIHYGLKEEASDKYLKSCDVDFVSGCCMLIPKKIFEEVGMLPEEYFMYYEDMDYCIQVVDKGFKIKYVPESVIYHCVSSSSGGEGSPFIIEWQSRARRMFWKKYKSRFSMIRKIYVPIKCDCRTVIKCLFRKNRTNNIRAYVKSFKSNHGLEEKL